MNTQISKVLLIVLLSAILGVSAGAAVGTFTFRTSGASDTVEAVDLVYPQRVPEADSVTTESIADGSVTPAKISSGYSLLTTAEKTQALTGSSTVNFAAKAIVATEGVSGKNISGVVAAGNTAGIHAGYFRNLSNSNSSQHGLYASVEGNGGTLINLVASGTSRFNIANNGVVTLVVSQTYANNAAALSGGLTAGMLYKTSDGHLMIVYNP